MLRLLLPHAYLRAVVKFTRFFGRYAMLSPSLLEILRAWWRSLALIMITIYGALTVWTTPSLEMPL